MTVPPLAEVQLAQAVAGLTRLSLDLWMTEPGDGPVDWFALTEEMRARREHAAGTLETISRLAEEADPPGWTGAVEPAPEPVPPLPPGEYGRVEMPGWRTHTGWITEETRFGQSCAVVRDRDGSLIAEVYVGPGCRVLPLPVPVTRAAPLAISGGWDFGADEDGPELPDGEDDPWHSAPEDDGDE